MRKRQGIMTNGVSEDQMRKLRRRVSPDVAEVLHMLESLESRDNSEIQSQSGSVAAR
ncbi:MAG TPA: hypothetical protein VH933_12100 [Aestuariivirgaceae bacterium]|jgi:hypothetical protein